jgi:hypothetical protein
LFLALTWLSGLRSGGGSFRRLTATFLAGALLAGCGEAPFMARAHPARTDQGVAAAARARAQVEPSVRALTASLRAMRNDASPAVAAAYAKCGPGSARRLSYNVNLTEIPTTRTSVTGLATQVAGMLRSAGWQLIFVDLRKIHFALPTQPHPVYQMTRQGLHGAANIVPDAQVGAEAIIFVDSPCFDAGSAATGLERHL